MPCPVSAVNQRTVTRPTIEGAFCRVWGGSTGLFTSQYRLCWWGSVRPRSVVEVGRPDAATIEIARQSCAAVADRPVTLAETFYSHLFDLAPEVRGMFPADMSTQHDRMSRTLVDAVRDADDPAAVERLLHRMGAAHARNHAVAPEHYPYVGRALVRAVRDLSPQWSSSVGAAWVQIGRA